ncbi:hypothetical protein UFOVP62_12 [uncultured Caudovirales phage]|uniref:Uncharacterized protein n=1 Tax=uncultured Caudovirales phage TaxID=2100421 RepID=A0A6J5KQ80_9CAUD|nr:hypothetical protein UFOVP62_12 [uncultured Caudovirales phage]
MANPASDGLPPEEIIKRVEKALRNGGDCYSWEDVREALLLGKFQLFWNEHGVCITEIKTTPRKRYLHCFVVAGEMPGVMELQDQVIQHALTSSCEFMTTAGRVGWERVLPKFGWRKTQAVMRYDLEGMV